MTFFDVFRFDLVARMVVLDFIDLIIGMFNALFTLGWLEPGYELLLTLRLFKYLKI